MPAEIAIAVRDLRHRYDNREALGGLSLDVHRGEVMALLGPNGSGKTTLFKLLSTLLPIQSGTIRVMGADAAAEPAAVRSRLGVVFQSPSVDKKLRVEENLRCAGALYGLSGEELSGRIDAELGRFGLEQRRRDFVETLSGGLRRRVELAQCMLHRPEVLVLDEPSTGLDPTARNDLWGRLSEARAAGVTVVVTTHLLEEAERADRIAILDRGELAALGTPDELKASVGGDTITLFSREPGRLLEKLRDGFGIEGVAIDGSVRVEHQDAATLAPRLYASLRDEIDELTLGRPTLEDVFIARTGRRFETTEGAGE